MAIGGVVVAWYYKRKADRRHAAYIAARDLREAQESSLRMALMRASGRPIEPDTDMGAVDALEADEMMPRVPPKLASRLAALVLVAGLSGGAFVAQQVSDEALRDEYVRAVAADADTSPAVKIAMVMGSYYESSSKHIGTPYIDRAGRGQPLTVCNGVTGAGVVAGRYYTPADCYRLERAGTSRPSATQRDCCGTGPPTTPSPRPHSSISCGTRGRRRWRTAPCAPRRTGVICRAPAGRTEVEPGHGGGVSTVLPGLQMRGDSNGEICAEWRVSP